MTTPAQEAKDFAAANGFTISPLDRRYVVSYPAAQFDTFVANVGGYPAALNAMRKYMDALRDAEVAAFNDQTRPSVVRLLVAAGSKSPELPVCARELPLTYTAQQQPINMNSVGIAFIDVEQTLDDVIREQQRRVFGAMGVKKAQPGRFRIDAPEGEYLGFPDRASALKYVRRNLAGVRGVSILPVEQVQ